MDTLTRHDTSNLSPLWTGQEDAKSKASYGELAPERLFFSQGVCSISVKRCAWIVFSLENAYHTQFEQTLGRPPNTMLTAPLPQTQTQIPTLTLIFQPRCFGHFARLFVFCSFCHWGARGARKLFTWQRIITPAQLINSSWQWWITWDDFVLIAVVTWNTLYYH